MEKREREERESVPVSSWELLCGHPRSGTSAYLGARSDPCHAQQRCSESFPRLRRMPVGGPRATARLGWRLLPPAGVSGGIFPSPQLHQAVGEGRDLSAA